MQRNKDLLATGLILLILFFVGCGKTTISTRGTNAIAVWDLENLTPTLSDQPNLGELLSSKVIDVIRSTGDYPIVERQRLILVLEELNLGTTATVDESTQLRIGNVVGARFMVFGSYQIIAGLMRVDLRLVDVETGKILKAAQRTIVGDNLSEWLEATQKAASELIL